MNQPQLPGAKKTFLALLFLLAFWRGSLYALGMPPWGLLDEEQHFDYILKLAQTGIPPVVGKDHLAPEVIQSILDTRRHNTFHWKTPDPLDLEKWGLEAHSYEGYQGPIYYSLVVPFYALTSSSLLDKLFALRVWMVIWSLLAVWIVFKMTSEIIPENSLLPFLVTGLFIAIPERTAATGRLSNDLLVELVALIFLWACSRAILTGISWKNALVLGLSAGVGLITKISFAGMFFLLPVVFLLNLRDKKIILKGLLTAFLAALVSLPFFAYNYFLYGDPTGFKGFADLYNRYAPLWTPAFTPEVIRRAIWNLFCHFWVIWWHGETPIATPWLNIYWAALLTITLFALAGLVKEVKNSRHNAPHRSWLLVSFLGIILVAAVLVMRSFFEGYFPVVQGRFMNTVYFPFLLLLALGLCQFKGAKYILAGLIASLLMIDVLVLFANFMPFFYYASTFYSDGQLVPFPWQGWGWAVQLSLTNFTSHRPTWAVTGFFLTLIGYIATLLGFIYLALNTHWRSASPILFDTPNNTL